MAAFKQHVAVSSTLGVAYTATCIYFGTEWSLAGLGGMLCALGGMLPDLDSDSGRPVAEIFGITAAVLPMLLIQRLRETGLNREGIILCLAACYLLFRFGAPLILGALTVHRGMFHSIPAALIAAEIVFLAHKTTDVAGSVKLGLGVMIGFLSHLVMDELWSVNLSGITIRLNKSAGSALKLWAPGLGQTLCAYAILAGLSYLVGVREGYFAPVQIPIPTLGAATLQH
jgi:membrane-bound metal-dependent hydrolase YbcI (DUF457 family)